jgi:cholesterol transport system auxiliary component
MRPFVALIALCAAACVTHREPPIRYDLGASAAYVDPDPRLNATIAIAPIQAPSWLSTTALLYRLDYDTPAHSSAYARSEWTAPPSELLTQRLQERLSAANDGFTLDRLPRQTDGYQLRVTLEDFIQVLQSPHESRCLVTLDAMLIHRGDQVLGQRTFRTSALAPTADARGAVAGFINATDSNLAQIVAWVGMTLAMQPASNAPGVRAIPGHQRR